MLSKASRSNDESIDAARMRGECENECHKKKLADLEKAKILLAWACRVYGPDGDADESEYNQFLRMGCAIANITPKTLARVSEDEVVATMLAEDRLEAERLLAAPQRDRGRPATPHKHLWIMAYDRSLYRRGTEEKSREVSDGHALESFAPHQQSTQSTRRTSSLSP